MLSYCRIERPPSIYGTYGKTVGDVFKPGTLQVLKTCYLDKYVEDVKMGLETKRAIWFFKKEEDIADVNDFLCEALPELASDPSTCPWVVNFSGVGPVTAKSIRERSGEISLYLTTAVMMMGINLENIQIVGMVRPFSMIHSLVQACGRGGRKTNEAGRQRVVFFLIYNRSDISDSVDISPAVRNFCLTNDCLKKTMMEYFGSTGDSGDSWCCSNCDRNMGLRYTCM